MLVLKSMLTLPQNFFSKSTTIETRQPLWVAFCHVDILRPDILTIIRVKPRQKTSSRAAIFIKNANIQTTKLWCFFLRVLPFLHISYHEFSYKKANSMCKSSECFIDAKPDQNQFFFTPENMQYVIMHIIHLHLCRTKLRMLAGYSDQFQSGLLL